MVRKVLDCRYNEFLTVVVSERLSRRGVYDTRRRTATWSTFGHPIIWRPSNLGSCESTDPRTASFNSLHVCVKVFHYRSKHNTSTHVECQPGESLLD